jgi:hypothetical protein
LIFMSFSSSSSISDKLGLVENVGGKDDRLSDKAGLVGGIEAVGGNSAIGETEGVAQEVEEDRRFRRWLW